MAVITTIRSAFGFLTRLPVGPWPLQNDLNGISAWLPLVGLVVGGLAGGLTWAATLLRGRTARGSAEGTQAGNHERLPPGHLRRHGPVL